MIKNIIFDIGNVLVINDHNAIFDGIINKDEYEKFNNLIFKSPTWAKLDLGTISTTDAIIQMEKNCNAFEKQKVEEIMSTFMSRKKWNDKMIKFAFDAKKNGYKIYLLSNITKCYHDYLENDKNSFIKHFDGGIFSYEEHLEKPDQQIYIELLKKYHINPKQSIFIDDKEQNIMVGKQVGIKGIKFDLHNFETFKKDFSNLINKDECPKL